MSCRSQNYDAQTLSPVFVPNTTFVGFVFSRSISLRDRRPGAVYLRRCYLENGGWRGVGSYAIPQTMGVYNKTTNKTSKLNALARAKRSKEKKMASIFSHVIWIVLFGILPYKSKLLLPNWILAWKKGKLQGDVETAGPKCRYGVFVRPPPFSFFLFLGV